MRFTLLVLLSGVLGFAGFLAIYPADAGECDRADCSWLVDLFDGPEASIPLSACILIVAVVVFGVAHLIGRALGRSVRH